MVSSSVILFFLWENPSPFSPVGCPHAHQKGSMTILNLCINTDCNISHNAFGMWTSRGSVFNCPKTSRVLCMRNKKHVYSVHSDSKCQITMLVATSAAGSVIPPCTFFGGNMFRTTFWMVLLLVHICSVQLRLAQLFFLVEKVCMHGSYSER